VAGGYRRLDLLGVVGYAKGGYSVSGRTVRQALEHAQRQRQYALPDAPNLVSDFILLADELARFRKYDCNHPPMGLHQVAYVSAESVERVWKGLNMMFEGTPVEAHPSVMDGLHLPQPDGTCVFYNY
jgi:hypothetical protein